ncbi:lytic polysaccharide monooxygenase [Xylaria bambusicola]|uniref:lytic polysaccharide monooxygenase n=1 Tax=Xylaria bambusicola TaxID=326684 RepID=UPI0020086D39|nr:lytic polysaccharide monooxygenase [Xylaria bambusicola]KAI0506806.1 lytic polysaccharide monooxygenase [Xylaria bambusicola]
MYSSRRASSQAALVSGLLLSCLPLANGHYGFPVVLINGITSKWWEFVRPTSLDAHGYQWFPDYSWDSEPMVCGWNGTKTGHETGIAKIEAGGVIGFRAFAASYNAGFVPVRDFDAQIDGVGHTGPGQAYMSKAPGAIGDYEGDGDWFKIGTSGASDGMHWDSDRQPEMNFTIPKATPPGQYLVRVEHFNISPMLGQTQLFVNCAQVEVLGSGEGAPGPTIKLPGYDPADPGIWLPRAMYNPYKPSELLKNYKGPGPKVWTG